MAVGIEHQALIELFRNRPSLAFELLGRPAGAVEVLAADAGEAQPSEARADLVLRTGAGASAAGLIVEVQRARDPDKAWAWPQYIANLRARHKHGFSLLVVTLSAPVAKWARRPIALGHPELTLRPLVIGPDEVPEIRDPDHAAAQPELAVLSSMAHGADPGIGRAAILGLARLDSARARLYADLVFTALGALAPQILEGLMDHGYTYQSDFARKYVAEGKAEGKAEGEALRALRNLRSTLAFRFPTDDFGPVLELLGAQPRSPEVWDESLRVVLTAPDAPAARAALGALGR